MPSHHTETEIVPVPISHTGKHHNPKALSGILKRMLPYQEKTFFLHMQNEINNRLSIAEEKISEEKAEKIFKLGGENKSL